MNEVPDRKKLRQEYVAKKLSAYTSGTVISLMFLPVALCTIAFGIGALCSICFCIFGIFNNESIESIAHPLIAFFACLFGACVTGVCSRQFWLGIKDAQKAAQLPYVPPVTADSLPAAEILVRGSEPPPVAHSEILLRAAQGNDTPKEELLRGTAEQ